MRMDSLVEQIRFSPDLEIVQMLLPIFGYPLRIAPSKQGFEYLRLASKVSILLS